MDTTGLSRMDNKILTNEQEVPDGYGLIPTGYTPTRTLESYEEGLPAILYEPNKDRIFINKLSDSTVRRMEKRYAKKKERKKYTFKKGTRHHNRKKATARRLRAKRWAEDPFSCYINGYGAHAVDRKLWDKHIAPIWSSYNPADLQIKKYPAPYGTRAKPYTVYSMDIIHLPSGSVVYNGSSQELYDLSSSSL